MKKLLFISFLGIIILGSCVKNIDFEQLDDIEIHPVLKTALIHFDVTSSKFVLFNITSDISNFEIFNNEIVENDLDRIEFVFEIENTFNKDIQIRYQFLDEDLNLVENINLFVESNTSKTETVIFNNTNLTNLSETRSLKVDVEITDNVGITSDMHLLFKSAAHIYLKIKTDA